MVDPSPSAPGGRGPGGKFAAGNGFSKGNPLAAKVQRLRAELINAVSPEDLRAVIDSLLRQAKEGDVIAAREVMDRVIGKPSPVEILQRVEALELVLAGGRASD